MCQIEKILVNFVDMFVVDDDDDDGDDKIELVLNY
jgi:hypothetical protein